MMSFKEISHSWRGDVTDGLQVNGLKILIFKFEIWTARLKTGLGFDSKGVGSSHAISFAAYVHFHPRRV